MDPHLGGQLIIHHIFEQQHVGEELKATIIAYVVHYAILVRLGVLHQAVPDQRRVIYQEDPIDVGHLDQDIDIVLVVILVEIEGTQLHFKVIAPQIDPQKLAENIIALGPLFSGIFLGNQVEYLLNQRQP